MEVIIQKTKQQAAEVAARLIANLLREKPDAVHRQHSPPPL